MSETRNKTVVVGSRGSKLAVTQTNWLLDVLRKAHPDITFELKIIKTKGDKNQTQALDKIGDKGLFTAELEAELLSGKIQMAVHSMKDMPSSLPEGLTLTVPPKREDPADVLVTPHDIKSLLELPQNATVGSGSKRRVFQLNRIRPDITCVGIRGNVDTRLRKMREQKLDGVILAAAGMKRLGVYDSDAYHVVPLNPSEFICAPAQGILAVEVRDDNAFIKEMMADIHDEKSRIQMDAERGFLTALNGDCHLPIGAYCAVGVDDICLYGVYGDEDGKTLATGKKLGSIDQAKAVGQALAEELKAQVMQHE